MERHFSPSRRILTDVYATNKKRERMSHPTRSMRSQSVEISLLRGFNQDAACMLAPTLDTIMRQTSGNVFLESNTPGVLDYYHVHIGTPKGTLLGRHFRQWYRRAMVKTLAHSVMNLAEHFVMQRIRLSVVAQFHARRGVHYCTNCLVRFAWLSPKKQCRCCGRVLCHKCVRLWTWYNKSAVQVPLCPNCVGTPPSPRQSALAIPQPIPVARDTSTGWSTLPGSTLANCSPLQPPTPQRFSSGLVINGQDVTRPENRWERGNASTMSLDLRPSFGYESSLVSAASAPSSSQNQVAFNP
ncbi:hypothetical protein AC1031_019819 [Aphanomyces cochlioides]|nr:hypothetical protein AC1031_019819 [Aphanomyces cochlioides]